MSPPYRPLFGCLSHPWWRAIAVVMVLPLGAVAQSPSGSPVGKVFISDVSGQAQIDTGEKIHELTRRSVYNAQGAAIETKPADQPGQSKTYLSIVYSNGTGAFLDADTRVEVKRFVQEPFTPTRTDFDVEPSISQTQAFIARGSVSLSTSRMVAGSSMVYQTPHATVNVLGRKMVIEATAQGTQISMVEGESTVRAGALDLGGHTLRAGEQAVIRRSGAGQPNQIQVRRIPAAEAPKLAERVALASMARRTVYFDVREQPGGAPAPPEQAAAASAPEAAAPEAVTTAEQAAEAAVASAAAGADPATAPATKGPAVVQAFYQNTATVGTTPVREIIAVPVVPANLPVSFVVSPANLPAPGR